MADEIWQYRIGGNLTIFNKDHNTAEEGQSRSLPEVNLQTGKVTVRPPSGLRPRGPRALILNLNVATKDKPLSRKS